MVKLKKSFCLWGIECALKRCVKTDEEQILLQMILWGELVEGVDFKLLKGDGGSR
jgi:hypothetical protein